MYEVRLADPAAAFFNAAMPGVQRRLERCFAVLADTPHRHPNVKRLHGGFEGAFRFRLGSYRILYVIREERQLVIVTAIGHRRDIYD